MRKVRRADRGRQIRSDGIQRSSFEKMEGPEGFTILNSRLAAMFLAFKHSVGYECKCSSSSAHFPEAAVARSKVYVAARGNTYHKLDVDIDVPC